MEFLINKKDHRIIRRNNTNIENPDYAPIDADSVAKIRHGKLTPRDYFLRQIANGDEFAADAKIDPEPPYEPKSIEATDVLPTIPLSSKQAADGRFMPDRDWLEKQKFDLLCALAKKYGKSFAPKDGKKAVVDFLYENAAM